MDDSSVEIESSSSFLLCNQTKNLLSARMFLCQNDEIQMKLLSSITFDYNWKFFLFIILLDELP